MLVSVKFITSYVGYNNLPKIHLKWFYQTFDDAPLDDILEPGEKGRLLRNKGKKSDSCNYVLLASIQHFFNTLNCEEAKGCRK